MRTLFGGFTDATPGCPDAHPVALTDPPARDPAEREKAAMESLFIPLKINVGTLRRLIHQQQLAAEDVRCLSGAAKSIIRQALLDSIASQAKPRARSPYRR